MEQILLIFLGCSLTLCLIAWVHSSTGDLGNIVTRYLMQRMLRLFARKVHGGFNAELFQITWIIIIIIIMDFNYAKVIVHLCQSKRNKKRLKYCANVTKCKKKSSKMIWLEYETHIFIQHLNFEQIMWRQSGNIPWPTFP